jgi:hypothetical protein
LLEWKRPNAKLKHEECRALIEQVQGAGLISLPKLRATAIHGPRKVILNNPSDPQSSFTGSAGQFEPLFLHLVQASDRELYSAFKQLVERWHYLGYRIPFGAHLNYLVESQRSPGRYLACLQLSSPAWKISPPDFWIGWDAEQRKRSLQFIVSASRFHIPSFVTVRGLASKVVSLASHRLHEDWERLYGYRPLLMDTLVERDRFSGACYRATNRIHLGCT